MTKWCICFQLLTIALCIPKLRKPHIIAICSTIPALISILLFVSYVDNPQHITYELYRHNTFNGMSVNFALSQNALSAIILCTTNVITAIINFYTIGYSKSRTRTYLFLINISSLFIAMLIASTNLLHMYTFWLALSITLFCMMCIEQDQHDSSGTPLRVLIWHLCGDICFIISIIHLSSLCKSLDINVIRTQIATLNSKHEIAIAATYLASAILIKSAQIGIGSWFKKITSLSFPLFTLFNTCSIPVIGICVLIKLNFIFTDSTMAQWLLITIGSFTAIACAVRATFAKNLNDILALLTSSQIGLMILACGFQAYGASVLLFITHAFTKSLLCLSAGSVNLALSNETNIEKMGGLFETLPIAYLSFLIATASIIGIPVLSYYYAYKSLIYELYASMLQIKIWSFIIIAVASCFTILCLFRCVYCVFHGRSKLDEISLAYANEKNPFINVPIFFSIFCTICSGVVFYYCAHNNIFWHEMLQLIDTPRPGALFAYYGFVLISIVLSIFMCKKIQSRTFSIEFFLNIDERFHKIIAHMIQICDNGLYTRCYLFLSRPKECNFNHKLIYAILVLTVIIYLTNRSFG